MTREYADYGNNAITAVAKNLAYIRDVVDAVITVSNRPKGIRL